MKLGIDVSRYKHCEATGVEWYSKHIVDALLPLIDAKPAIDEACFYSPKDFSLPLVSEKFKKRIIPFPRLWTQARLSYEILTKTPDVLFVPSHTIPVIYPRKSVITIHDVAFMRFKLSYSFAQYRYLCWSTKFAVKNAHRIIVPSEATKKDLLHFFKCDESKVYVVHHGQPDFVDAGGGGVGAGGEGSDAGTENAVAGGERAAADTEGAAGTNGAADLSRFEINNAPYILFVGRLESKKNLLHLLDAFDGFSKEFPDWKLVLAGKDGVGSSEIKKKVDTLEGRGILTGYVSESEKAALYSGAEFIAFPSLYEGFGFPILEAFQHKKALLTSRGSACEEVAQDGALLIDSHDKHEICEGMKKLAMNEKLRKELIEKGEQRLSDFSWEKTAKETLAVLLG